MPALVHAGAEASMHEVLDWAARNLVPADHRHEVLAHDASPSDMARLRMRYARPPTHIDSFGKALTFFGTDAPNPHVRCLYAHNVGIEVRATSNKGTAHLVVRPFALGNSRCQFEAKLPHTKSVLITSYSASGKNSDGLVIRPAMKLMIEIKDKNTPAKPSSDDHLASIEMYNKMRMNLRSNTRVTLGSGVLRKMDRTLRKAFERVTAEFSYKAGGSHPQPGTIAQACDMVVAETAWRMNMLADCRDELYATTMNALIPRIERISKEAYAARGQFSGLYNKRLLAMIATDTGAQCYAPRTFNAISANMVALEMLHAKTHAAHADESDT